MSRRNSSNKSKKPNSKALKYSVCCAPEEHCAGEHMLMIDSGGLLTVNPKKGLKNLMRVHSDNKSSAACSQAYWCSK